MKLFKGNGYSDLSVSDGDGSVGKGICGVATGRISALTSMTSPKLTDVQVFYKKVFNELRHEEEDGLTLVTKMFDAVFRNAVEDGAEGIVVPDDDWYEGETTTDSTVSEHAEIRSQREMSDGELNAKQHIKSEYPG
jgi:hypothetical protein